ncbi:MAG: hypothetical protein WCB27_01265 [Thermoguttaceae bacterium]
MLDDEHDGCGEATANPHQQAKTASLCPRRRTNLWPRIEVGTDHKARAKDRHRYGHGLSRNLDELQVRAVRLGRVVRPP